MYNIQRIITTPLCVYICVYVYVCVLACINALNCKTLVSLITFPRDLNDKTNEQR